MYLISVHAKIIRYFFLMLTEAGKTNDWKDFNEEAGMHREEFTITTLIKLVLICLLI